MNTRHLIDFYCLSYKNEDRKQAMIHKFEKLGIHAFIYEGVGSDDSRYKELNGSSMMLGHLDMIYKFYTESDKEYGIICEDDICIHNDLTSKLDSIIKTATSLNLDIVMIGYLLNHHIEYDGYYGYTMISSQPSDYHFYTYHQETWGTQMYMISKTYAKYLIDSYNVDYAKKEKNYPYTSDWIITKKTNSRALIYPPLCIENGDVSKFSENEYCQKIFHLNSHTIHVNDNFI